MEKEINSNDNLSAHFPNMEYDLSQINIKMKMRNGYYKNEIIKKATQNTDLNNFIAIDFETANSSRSSACTLGLAEYKNNKLIDTKYWIFKPVPFKFDSMNIKVTGLNPNDFESAPYLSDIWKEIKPYISNKLIVAHNASFDIDVLKKTLIENNIEVPSFNFLCTYILSKSYYTDLDNYKLNTVAKKLQLREFNHHNALEDATICGEVANKFFEGKKLQDLLTESKIQLGIYSPYYEQNCKLTNNNEFLFKKSNTTKSYNPYYQEISKKVIDSYHNLFLDNDFLNNKHIAITGDFTNFNRNELTSLLGLSSTTIHQTVTKAVSLLLLGNSDKESSKYQKAKSLISNGQEIKILTENELLENLNSEKIKMWEIFNQIQKKYTLY